MDLDHLAARSIVLELLVASVMLELARHATRDVESLRRIMLPVEDQLAAMAAEATPEQRRTAEMARQYFRDMLHGLLATLPHQGNH